MSQFPLGAALNPTGAPRNVTLSGGGQRSVVGRVAPGLAIRPPTSQDVTTAGQLARVAGGAAGLTRSALAYRRSQLQQRLDFLAEQERDQQRREAEQIDDVRNAQRLLTGIGVSEARTRLADLDVALNRGDFDDALGGDVPIGDIAREIADSVQLTDGLHTFAAQRARDAIAERLTATLGRRRQGVYEQQQESHAFAWRTGLVNGADVQATMEEAVQMWPEVPRERLESSILVPAMQEAAMLGESDTVAGIAEALGDRFRGEQQRAQAVLSRQVEAQLQAVRSEAEDAVFGLLNDGRLEDADRVITELRSSDTITEKTADRLYGEVQTAQRRREAEFRSEQLRAERLRNVEGLELNALWALRGGRAYGVEDQTFTLSDGTTQTVSRADQIARGAARITDRIEQETGVNTPVTVSRVTDMLGANGLTHAPYARRFASAATAGAESLDDPERRAQLEETARMWLSMDATNPAVAHNHAGEHRGFWSFFELSYRYGVGDGTQGDVIAALRNARNATSGEVAVAAVPITSDDLTKQVNKLGHRWWWFDRDIKNRGEMMSRVRSLADLHMRLGSADKETAIEAAGNAINKTYALVNGFAIPSRDGNNGALPVNFPVIAEQFLNGYFDRHRNVLEEQGIDSSDDLALVPAFGENWQVVNVMGGSIVGADEPDLTSLRLFSLWDEQSEEAKQAVISDWNRRNPNAAVRNMTPNEVLQYLFGEGGPTIDRDAPIGNDPITGRRWALLD